MRKCSVDGCEQKYRRNGMCHYHYNRSDICKQIKYKTNRNGGRFSQCKGEAKRRNLEWNLSREFCEEMWKKPCFYCEGYFGRSETGCGMDRIDNNKGYIENNVVACCGHCNEVKSSHLNLNETKLVLYRLILEDKIKKLSAA